jgi:ABC-type dipeptide/oligopeptide/nickel transport system ATPase component
MLSIENLSVEYYRRGQIIRAVQEVSFAIEPGETVGLVGESGSGKSTVALAILRLIRPQEGRITSGRIRLGGDDLLALPEDRLRDVRGKRISMIFQDPFTSLNPVMRIRDQMAEEIFAHSDAAAPDSVLAESLDRVQLDSHRILSSYPHQLSGGQRQRVAIAMSLLNKPDLLLADEPTTALDVLVQKEILELLFRLQKKMNMGMLFITHNLAVVAQYAPGIIVMKEGRIVEKGLSKEIFRAPQEPYTQRLVSAVKRL